MITTAIMSAEEPDTSAIVKAAGAAGITHYRWGGIKYTTDSPKEYIARLRPQFARLADLNAKHNVCGIYHTHSGINEVGASIWDLCETLDGVDPKALGINYDIGHATVEGGTIVLLAECSDGLGRADFLKWFDARDSRALAARLVNGYEVNGQTAWALLTKAERYRVCLVSELPPEDVLRMRMIPVRTISEALEQASSGDGFIMPRGAAVMPRIEAQ